MSDQRKEQLQSKMRHHQQEYSKYASEMKEITSKEEAAKRNQRQLDRLEKYKPKYKFFALEDGTAEPINWDEVEEQVKSYLGKETGYALGFDETGAEGLGCSLNGKNVFKPMVEEESDARKYRELLARRAEFYARQNKS